MLKSNLCYPFPVLRNESIDYKSSTFDVKIDKNVDSTSHIFEINYDIRNTYIKELVNDGYAKVGLIVKSNAVWYRKFFDITNSNIVRIDAKEIYGRVYLLPCIIATKKIENFYSDDFDEEFKISNISVNAGEIIGISDEMVFDAILNNDIFKNSSSIFDIISTNENYISYDLTQSKIVVMIPKSLHDRYKSIERSSQQPAPILNSMVIFPILVEALEEMKRASDDFDDTNSWCKTIKKTIEVKHKEGLMKGLDINGDIDDPYLVAQCLTNGLLLSSCDRLSDILVGLGGDA